MAGLNEIPLVNGDVEKFRLFGKTMLLLYLYYTPYKTYTVLGFKRYKWGTLADIERSITGAKGTVRDLRATFEAIMKDTTFQGLFISHPTQKGFYCIDEDVLLSILDKQNIFSLAENIAKERIKRRNIILGDDT